MALFSFIEVGYALVWMVYLMRLRAKYLVVMFGFDRHKWEGNWNGERINGSRKKVWFN